MSNSSRRSFLREGVAAALSAGVLVACRAQAETVADTPTPPAPPPPPPSPTAAADAMDAMCEKGVKAFPAKTEGKGNVVMRPRVENGVKIFDLTASKIQWEITPGQKVEAFAYNGMIPGPQIRVKEGERVRINLKNELDQSTAIHFHGLSVPNDQDGVPFITQPPIKPRQSYTYEFTVPHAGSHMYHSHHNATTQVMKGLLGAFIVEPKEASNEPKVALDYVMILNDGLGGFSLNGKGFPATEPLVATKGETIRIRYMNEGMMIHPMHLHGMPMTVIAKDGWAVPAPWKCDTLNIAPGERWDVLVHCTNPGTWAFHCHILAHAESEQGMFGMVTALVVKPA
ncbi:MAG TPA: copper oxidase [Gemmatimonadaceae bacterium]|nr:copper oxidase [Gemmatimonadaceae bacterium]